VDVFGIGFSNEFEWNLIVKIIIIMKMWFKKDIYDYVQQWQMECYQPYDHNWNAQNELYDNWINDSTYVFQNMKCCAICGIVKLNHQHKYLILKKFI